MTATPESASAYFEKLGGTVTVDKNSLSKPVVGLSLKDSKVSDTDLVHLKGLTNLQMLDLWGTNVTDAGLVNLKGLTKLRELRPLGHQGHRRWTG